jgi:hypothetical protein
LPGFSTGFCGMVLAGCGRFPCPQRGVIARLS